MTDPIAMQDTSGEHRLANQALGEYAGYDREELLGALDRLDTLDSRRVLPGHGPTHNRLHELVERSRESIQSMLADATAVVAEEETTVLDLAQQRAGERDFHYVLPEVYSALAHLESEGKVSSRLEDDVRYYVVDG